MNSKEVEKVLEELQGVRPEKLNGEAKRLFEANNRINDLLDIEKQKDKIIDLMAEQLAGIAIWNNEKEEPLILMSKGEVIKYFEERCNK